MVFQIDVQNQGEPPYPVDAKRLEEVSAAVLAQHDVHPDSSLSVVIADNDFVRALNQQYRGIDSPTDVLSFPADEPPVAIDDEPPYLGDLIIAFPYASAQAAREQHDLGDSLALLVVHGTLHLLGYDHDITENRAEMWAAQESALHALNIPLNIVPALEVASHDDPA
ncbi:MAG: rRNA maturation RNase YbeY [Chloroflexota bacterium]